MATTTALACAPTTAVADPGVTPSPGPTTTPDLHGDTASSSTPGPAQGDPQIVAPTNVTGAGQPVPVLPPSTATAVTPQQVASTGTVTDPAAAPSTAGWITSRAWDVAPASNHPTAALPVFARDVVLPKPPSAATLTMAGLGLYAPTVNGRPASPAVLQPGPSDFTRSVEYRSYDVTRLLSTGTNRLGVALGTGVYDEVHLPGRYSKLVHIGGALGFTARLDVRFTDGTRTSLDTSRGWWTRPSGTTASDWYGGESFDARRGTPGLAAATTPLATATGWAPAVQAAIPASVHLYPQTTPPVIAGTPVPAASVSRLGSDWVVDFGRYITGQPQLRLAAPAGRTVRLYPAERLAGGVPDQTTMRGRATEPIYDEYTFAGRGTETWHPQFDYHGFRYLRVTGLADRALTPAEFSAIPVGAALPHAGSVSSSSSFLNTLVRLTNTAEDANLQAIPTDCPNREKLGWLEQDYLLFGMLSGRFDISRYAPNVVRLLVEAQRPDGSLPEISPEVVHFPAPFDDDVNWGSALVLVPWQLYRTYGQTGAMTSAYPAMTRYVAWLQSHATRHLLDFGLGDWITPAPGADRTETTSMGYYLLVSTLAREASVLGHTADAAGYRALAGQVKSAINATYWRDGMYGSEQATNAMGLVLGLAPDPRSASAALVSLVAAAHGHFNTGEIGLSYLFTALHSMDRDDLLWTAIRQPDAPGFGSFVTSGAPALPEYWNGMHGIGSLAHFMLGYPTKWAQDSLAGIDQTDDSVGYQHLLIRPAVYTGPDQVSATRVTRYGTVAVAWTRSGATAHVKVTVPAGSRATVMLPDGRHEVGAGSTSFDTGLGVRDNYGAAPFLVPTGTLTRVPWSGAFFGTVNGTTAHLTRAQWQATGWKPPVPGIPAGSVVTRAPGGSATLLAWTADGVVHPLTLAEWTAVGRPRPVAVTRLMTKYQWSSSVWLTTEWAQDPGTWAVAHLSLDDYRALGSPSPDDSVLTPHSRLVGTTGAGQVAVIDPDGTRHTLSAAEWSHLGTPAPKTSP